MCGRIACTLAPDVICRACSYKDTKTGSHKKPTWKDHPPSKDQTVNYTYYPSVNVSPTRFTPVMYKLVSKPNQPNSSEKISDDTDTTSFMITPMMFGLIPSYHRGDAKSHGLSTNNCRLEGILESKLYKKVLAQRKLCVILAQGFYEWKTVGAGSAKQGKQPYLIFAPQEDKAKLTDASAWDTAEWSEETGWQGPNILKIAGLFDVWKSPTGDEVYSYTIITMESNETLSWLHDRMPAILETEEQVQAWLNGNENMNTNDLLSILKPATRLDFYPVNSKVGNSRCHDTDCMKPMEVKENKSKTFMDNWLKKKPAEEKQENEITKKPKLEEDKP